MVDGGGAAGDLTLADRRWCLDFANTVDWRTSDRPEDALVGYPELVAWSQREGILSEGEAARLLQQAAERPAEAAAVFADAIALREALYRVFSRHAHGLPPAEADLAQLNAALSRSLGRLSVAAGQGGFVWRWVDDGRSLDRVLWPVVRSAAELLVSAELSRVRECEGRGCGWLFLDATRNRSRRWCSMDSCGNRAKARRHYEKRRQAGQGQ